MRLLLDTPWKLLAAPDQRHIAVGPDAVVTFGPLELASQRALLAVDLPAGAAVRVQHTEDRETRDGWPLRIVDAEVVAGAAPIEARCYACYRFLAYTAVAIARGADLGAQRATLISMFETGRPDFRDEPICLADTFALDGASLVDERELETFAADGFDVIAVESLRGAPLFAFHAVRAGELLPASVRVETSETARAAGTPYVIAVVGATYRVVATHARLPPYTELKRQILPLLVEAVRALS